jgi:hypothetical protein
MAASVIVLWSISLANVTVSPATGAPELFVTIAVIMLLLPAVREFSVADRLIFRLKGEPAVLVKMSTLVIPSQVAETVSSRLKAGVADPAV